MLESTRDPLFFQQRQAWLACSLPNRRPKPASRDHYAGRRRVLVTANLVWGPRPKVAIPPAEQACSHIQMLEKDRLYEPEEWRARPLRPG